jgi:hypothetical protein
MSNTRLALYFLPIGRIADRIPRCVVARSVALARSEPMQNLSARRSAVQSKRTSVEPVRLPNRGRTVWKSHLLTVRSIDQLNRV